MSCHDDQGTAQTRRWDGPDESNVMTSGFLQVVPQEFTRDELRALLSKARALAQYGIFDDTKRDLLVDLAETLDLLDALEARDEADLAELEGTIREHSMVSGININSPKFIRCERRRCGSDCPYVHSSDIYGG